MAAPEGFSDMAACVDSSRSSRMRNFPPLRITARALKGLRVMLATVGLEGSRGYSLVPRCPVVQRRAIRISDNRLDRR